MTAALNDTTRLIRQPEVTHLTGLARRTIYEKIEEAPEDGGNFPRPVKLGRISAWVEAEVHAWIADQIKRRNDEAAAPKGTAARKSAGISAKSDPHHRNAKAGASL